MLVPVTYQGQIRPTVELVFRQFRIIRLCRNGPDPDPHHAFQEVYNPKKEGLYIVHTEALTGRMSGNVILGQMNKCTGAGGGGS
jgi:hypothetical protein